jgi:excisionase family DNA binding protein
MLDNSPEVAPTALRLEDVAKRWNVSVKWLRKQIWSNNLKAVRYGRLIRVPVAEVQRFERSRPAA